MTTNPQHFVIIGGGLAGAKLAEGLRAHDFPGQITILAAEDELPYERPPLSKKHLAGKEPLADFTVFNADWYRDHRVDLRLGTTAKAFDPVAKTVTLPDDSTLSYDKLALATGSRSRVLNDIAGGSAPNVYTLRTIDDSDEIAAMLEVTPRLAIIGGGWIGLEVAAVARQRGLEVTILEAGPQPVSGTIGQQMGAVFAALQRNHGVDVRTNTEVAEILTDNGVATGVFLADGQVIAADAVLVAVGALPNVEAAVAAGLVVDNGIHVNESLASSNPDIVAVGDIAAQYNPTLGRRVRVEHWANALNQPAVAAKTMLGIPAVYDRLPYFFTDQYDLGMEYTGYVGRDDDARLVVRGDTDSFEFIAFWLDPANKVLAGMNVNVWDVTDRIKELILSGKSVDPDDLADVNKPL
ncbi:NAD(P)/FAD-dependent oxidoreductase [Nocardia camponoti]|uniref:Pyridine nucleotide-disulfide oxidoreductase n=1 Tax=Nocardia camponoti TaxID=1616106 RepID=A0A917QRE3_9NOCA|nr:FAD-dependent oxidoreductase [Nocardia camponoti]GGK64221.1 pyridine nucleotide-disulfide oxidoreductase [Nocardia camponoti]